MHDEVVDFEIRRSERKAFVAERRRSGAPLPGKMVSA
jgi:hypothetical protein